MLINLVKISFIFSSKPEIAFGIFFGFSSFDELIKDFLETFFPAVFFVFFKIFDLDTLEDLDCDFFLVNFFLKEVFFLGGDIFFLTVFFFFFFITLFH